MTLSPARAPHAHASEQRRLAATLYGYMFLDDFVVLYPVYALLFSDSGLSVWQISSLFVIWSLTGILLEVPSGVWADAVSRRLLLCAGPLLTATGFALWVLTPAYWAFALGFVLWGAKGAFASGALEALVYEEFDRLGAAGRYARTMGRARSASLLGVMLAMALAGPVLVAGGYRAAGFASVVVCLLTAAVATRFPEHRDRSATAGGDDGDDGGEGGGERGWARTLRAGVAEARADRSVRAALLLVPAVTALWGALDEYTPLLVRDTGVPETAVPLLLLLIWAGATAGGLLAGAAERLADTGFAALLGCAALAMAVGAALRLPAGIALVACAFCGFQLAGVLADARLQERITGPSRATVTSLAGVGTDLATVGVYGAYGVVGSLTAHGSAFAVFAVPYLLVALLLLRRPRLRPRLRRRVRA